MLDDTTYLHSVRWHRSSLICCVKTEERQNSTNSGVKGTVHRGGIHVLSAQYGSGLVVGCKGQDKYSDEDGNPNPKEESTSCTQWST